MVVPLLFRGQGRGVLIALGRLKDGAERLVMAPRSGYVVVDRESLGATGGEFLIYERR